MEGETKGHVSKEHKTSHSKPSTHVKKRSKSKKSKHEKHKRKRRSSSTSSSFDTSATTLSIEKRKKKKRYRSSSSSSDSHDKKHNKKKKMKKKKKKKYLEAKEVDTVTKGTSYRNIVEETKNEILETGKKRPMVPMTKEEFERQQSIVRRVYDPETGRNRLIKGDGEVIEEIVSKTRHKEINKMSTLHDGQYFASSIGLNKR